MRIIWQLVLSASAVVVMLLLLLLLFDSFLANIVFKLHTKANLQKITVVVIMMLDGQ